MAAEDRVNHWQESAELLARLSGSDAGEPAALATVVRVVGSAYRRPGAKLLVTGDGGNLGSVSGGCLEADVREVAQRVMESGTARLLHYDTSAGEEEVFGLGMGCRGRVEVLVQPVDVALRALLPRWRDLLAGDARFAVLTVAGGAGSLGTTALVAPDGTLHGSLGATLDPLAAGRAGSWLAAGRSGCEELGGHMVFVEALPPPRHLLICGAGDDAVPLVHYAADAGFRVTTLDHRPGLLTPARFPRATRLVLARPDDDSIELPAADHALGVVMTHSFAHDRDWTRRLLAAGLPYVGLLGPRARTAEIRRAIGAERDGRLFGPVGLDLGADGPRQVAISIVAELLAVVAGRIPRHLNERTEALHVG